jgi:transposase
MSASPALYHLYVGADIAAKTVTYSLLTPGARPQRAFTLPQGSTGYAALHARLTATGLEPGGICLVLEATSTYWIRLALFLYEAGYAVCVINPKQGHDFAKALRQPGKSDALDAQGLARFAAQMAPARWTPPPAVYQEVGQRLSQRDDLVKLQTALRNQLHALDHQAVVVAAVRPPGGPVGQPGAAPGRAGRRVGDGGAERPSLGR